MSAALKKKLKKAQAQLKARKFGQAEALFSEVLKLDPKQPEALHHMGVITKAKGSVDVAIRLMQASLAQDNRQDNVHFDLGLLYEEQKDIGQAAQYYAQAWQLKPEHSPYLYSLVNVLQSMRSKEPNASYLQLVSQAMMQPTVDGDALFSFWFSLFRFTATWQALESALHKEVSLKALSPVLEAPVLTVMLCNSTVYGVRMEAALTKIRKHCLLDWKVGDIPFIFLVALAYQGFRNEYVWDVSEAEAQKCAALEVQAKQGALTAAELLLLAAYKPLYRVEGIAACADVCEQDASGLLSDIWRQQVDEPFEEARIKADIPMLTAIKDDVSQHVRAQYEVNPYPRWTALSSLDPTPFKKHFAGLFSHLPKALLDAIPLENNVLVAGGGSGKHPLWLASVFSGHHVTAVDLSKTSLAYAIRKKAELQLAQDVQFGQADILRLGEAFDAASFDIIECSGVLHHMDDPMAGWKVLTGLLMPGGLMKIGLYSEMARVQVTAMRDKIAAEGIPATDDGIRSLRAYVKTHIDEESLHWIPEVTDFYAMSACRDLLFHVQEHQFTLPKIEQALETLGLEFLGFEGGSAFPKTAFQEMFPGAVWPGTLAQWHAFEQQNPKTFVGMYQFWLRKV